MMGAGTAGATGAAWHLLLPLVEAGQLPDWHIRGSQQSESTLRFFGAQRRGVLALALAQMPLSQLRCGAFEMCSDPGLHQIPLPPRDVAVR